MNERLKKKNGITLVALVITIIILLILAGITINALGGKNGLIAKVNQAKKAHIKAEMKENLILEIEALQLEKSGKATLDDITQEWADNALESYNPQITSDASINGKKVTMKKGNVTGKYIIDENLNIKENIDIIDFSYEMLERVGNKVKITIHVQDEENGLSKIELPGRDAIMIDTNKQDEQEIGYEVELGVEYKVKITSENGQTKEETILITDYWHKIIKNLAEGIKIDNTAIKAAYNKQYQAKITAGEDYIIDAITVKMDGQEVVVDKATGIINIEKVTGDIEITATAKKLEINTTTPIVSTSKNATSSTPSNTVTKGTPVYIKFTATLNITGGTCTIDKTIPYQVSANGIYTFTVTGTYESRTVTKEIEVKVDQYQSASNLVKYDAGDWTESEIQSLQTAGLYNLNASKTVSTASGLNLTFGGFTYKGDTENSNYINNGTIITSRNQSVAPRSGYGTPKYDGWQILESHEENNKTYVTKLIHAGNPENFVFTTSESSNSKRAEYILSSGLRQTSYNTYSTRSWQMYVDKNQENLIADTKDKDGNIVKDIHAMTYDEAFAIIGSISETNGLRYTSSRYWLGNTYEEGDTHLWIVDQYGYIDFGSSDCWGIRPVVCLKSGVYIKSGSGTGGDPYVLAIE